MTICCYFYWNARFTFGYGDNQIKRISQLKHLIVSGRDSHPEALAINVSYDRQLVPYVDGMGIPVGDLDITDRADLLRLMDSLYTWNNYRYIVCDVHFDTTIRTSSDSALYARMASMRHLVVASGDMNPSALKEKLACAEYDQFIKGNRFIKFRFFARDGGDSVPLRMFKELDCGSLFRWGPFYYAPGQLCVNSVIPDLDYKPMAGWDAAGEKHIWNLGADILDQSIDISPLFEDKIVLIGDWVEKDNHFTIRGRMPGTAIVYNAYLSLKNRSNVVSLWVMLVLFFTFMAEISFAFRYYWKEVPEKPDWAVRHPFLHALCRLLASWIGYTGVLWIVCAMIYVFCGFFVNAFVVGSLIAFVSPYLKKPHKS